MTKTFWVLRVLHIADPRLSGQVSKIKQKSLETTSMCDTKLHLFHNVFRNIYFGSTLDYL